jgi:hypothetical protein
VLECLTWSRDLHAEDGSAGAVARLTSALQAMESLLGVIPPLPGELRSISVDLAQIRPGSEGYSAGSAGQQPDA